MSESSIMPTMRSVLSLASLLGLLSLAMCSSGGGGGGFAGDAGGVGGSGGVGGAHPNPHMDSACQKWVNASCGSYGLCVRRITDAQYDHEFFGCPPLDAYLTCVATSGWQMTSQGFCRYADACESVAPPGECSGMMCQGFIQEESCVWHCSQEANYPDPGGLRTLSCTWSGNGYSCTCTEGPLDGKAFTAEHCGIATLVHQCT
jgi:hypothetical protein